MSPLTPQEPRTLHLAFNVAVARRGVQVPACDGTECDICAALASAGASAPAPQLDSDKERVKVALYDLMEPMSPDYEDISVGYLAELAAKELKAHRDAVQRSNDADAAYNVCEAHQPNHWEGDGTCVICEGHALKDQIATFQRREAALREALQDAVNHCEPCEGTGSYWFRNKNMECARCKAWRAALASPDPEKEPTP